MLTLVLLLVDALSSQEAGGGHQSLILGIGYVCGPLSIMGSIEILVPASTRCGPRIPIRLLHTQNDGQTSLVARY